MRRSRLGQNFLFDQVILRKIVEASALSKEDTVVEIGPGPGTLTRLLSEYAKNVIAVELDENLIRKLRRELAGYLNVELVHADALDYPYEDIDTFKVVANIPYYITTPIIFRLLQAKGKLKTMTLTVQKEVAERIVASPGGKDYGVLSIMVQYRAKAGLKFVIPKEAFTPVPKVDSAVVNIALLDKPSVDVIDEKKFISLVRTAFSQRRKTVANSLKGFGHNIHEALAECDIDPKRRPETLSIEEFAKLSELL